MVLSLRALAPPDPIEVAIDKFAEEFSAPIAAWFEAKRKSHTKTWEHHQNELQAQHDGDLTDHEDEDPITPKVGDCKDFQAQIEASNPPIRQVYDQLIHDKVK